jgi:hypothetical protein
MLFPPQGGRGGCCECGGAERSRSWQSDRIGVKTMPDESWTRGGRAASPVSRFAGRLGIDPRRVSRWASRLESRQADTVRFLPVRVAADGVDGRQASTEIALGHGRHVRVATGFAADDLRRVLAILDERMPC